MKKERKGLKIIRNIFIIIILLAMIGVFLEYREYSRPTTDGNDIEVEIAQGTSTMGTVNLLKEKGIIHFKLAFMAKLKQTNSYSKLRYGSYILNDGMSYDDIIKTLLKGGKEEGNHLKLIVPEGFTAEMIAARLEDQGIMEGQAFLDALKAKAKEYTEKNQEDLPAEDQVYYQLQGYLYPDTYYLEEDITPEELIDMFLKEFDHKFDDARRQKAKELNMSVNEVLIRASLVQKETDLAREFPTIAGVIRNRLEKGMRLQFDSTVVYAMTEGQYGVSRVMNSDLKYDSPYNTYKVNGLPPGPICNPGLEAIDGVLNAEDHNYLFFQTDTVANDGSNLFFETYEEHLAASSTANRGGETTATEASTEADQTATTEAGTETDQAATTEAGTGTD